MSGNGTFFDADASAWVDRSLVLDALETLDAFDALDPIDGVADPLPVAAEAVGAFVLLLFRYTWQEGSLAVSVAPAPGREPRVIDFGVSRQSTVGELVAQAQRLLRGLVWGQVATLEWAGEGQDALVAQVSIGRAQIDLRRSQARGALSAVPMERIARHFRAAARACHSDRLARMGAVKLIDPAERATMARWISPQVDPSIAAPQLLHTIFEETARQHSARVAVVCGPLELTYGELSGRATKIARALRARGIGPGDFVAFQLPRSADVYVVLLGVLEAGAAYVPLDPEYPVDRIDYILADCGAKALITVSSLVRPLGVDTPVLRLDVDDDWQKPVSEVRAPAPLRKPTPRDVAYVIYTSGSTGQPKGVAVEHRSAAHLVLAERRLFGVVASDRVFQGFSVAFDAAVEEVWLAFASGAALVVGFKEAMVADLAGTLAHQRVTVLSTVPTLLATAQGDLAGVRLLILGGEACPLRLVERFASADRAMYNTYGPTEATVIATCERLAPGRPVTIGQPLPNYRVYILDPEGRLAPAGVAGEIAIGGVGVARGYVGRAELTAAKFVADPEAAAGDPSPVLYLTGDRGRYDSAGHIEFLGRQDDQVKLRGFRIELGEVEAALSAAGAAQAVVTLRGDSPGASQLVAYVVLGPEPALTKAALQERTRTMLPPYMVPAHIEVLDSLPMLTSGKVDKKSLPPPSAIGQAGALSEDELPRGALEQAVARSWREILGVAAVGRNAHFFFDLGGDSLLAAQVTSCLRRTAALQSLSVRDVYEHPTVAGIAALGCVAADAGEEAESDTPAASPTLTPRWKHALCGAAQVVALYGVFAIYSSQWLGPYLAYTALRAAGQSTSSALLVSGLVLILVYPLMLLVGVVTKWVVIGRYKAGRYPLWGLYYFRCWLVDQVLALAPTDLLEGTPLINAYYRLLGARIGRHVHLASDGLGCADLVSIGDDATIGHDADICGSEARAGVFVLGEVKIGSRCVVGPRAVLTRDVVMGDDAVLGPLSLLAAGASVPAGERWAGSPASFESPADVSSPIVRPSRARHAVLSVAYAAAALTIPLFLVAAIAPGLATLTWLDGRIGDGFLLASPFVAVLYIVLLCLEIAAAKWLLLGRVKPGRYEVHGSFGFRKWLFDQAMGLSLEELGSLYATLFFNPWFRMLGARIGKNAEVSTASSVVPDLVRIDDEAFVADYVSLGAPWVGRGIMSLGETHVGSRAFVGNSAVVPGGGKVTDQSLLGCLSIAPATSAGGSTWFGSPAIALPKRQASRAFPDTATYRPTRKLVAQRLAFESLRVALPVTFAVFLSCLLVRVSLVLSHRMSTLGFVALFPLLYVAMGLLAVAIVVALKWLLIGRYRPAEQPLWSTFVWRSELVTAMHEGLANSLFVHKLAGTPLLPWFFRALGAAIGRRVCMATTELTEYDLVSVGDESCLSEDCTLQTHLFEDRVMKMSTVHVGARCSVGSGAVVLYDTHLEDGSSLDSLSLLMKGESLPAGSDWRGIPARRVRKAARPS